MLEEKKFKNYLFYALGEVILIVVGILIALQINSWNEDRKERILLDQYKKSFLRDLKDDLVDIQERIKNAEARIKGVERFLNYLENVTEYGEFEKREDLLRAGWLNFFAPSLSTYNDLISSGNIKLINDDSLKFLINDYIAHFNRIIVYEEHDKKNVWDQYGLYYRQWVDGRMISNYLIGDTTEVLKYPVQWEKIEQDAEFKRRMSLVLETGYGQIARYDRLKKKIEHFIKYLEQHD